MNIMRDFAPTSFKIQRVATEDRTLSEERRPNHPEHEECAKMRLIWKTIKCGLPCKLYVISRMRSSPQIEGRIQERENRSKKN